MKRKIIKILTGLYLTALLFAGCAYYNTLFNAKKAFGEGIKIIQNEPEKDSHPRAKTYFEQTIDKCWKLIEIYGDDSKYADDALLYIIKSEFYIKKYTQARLHSEKFISKYPKSELAPEVYLWYGKVLLKEKKEDKGREYLNRSITLANKSGIKAQAYYELGNLAFQDSSYYQAVDYFERALDEDIDEQYAAFLQFYLAESYFKQKQYAEAIPRYKKVEKFSPSLDVEYKTKFNLARSFAEIGKYEDGLKILRKMLTAPRFKNFIPVLKTEIGSIYQRQGKLQEAIALYEEVVKERARSEGTAEASFRLARIYENRIQNVDSAVYYYGQVRQVYAKYDSVEKAEDKHVFLSELKKLRDNIKNDRKLVYRLENDPYFRDSLYTAQKEDSIRRALGQISQQQSPARGTVQDSLQNMLDSLNTLTQDSLAEDTTESVEEDTTSQYQDPEDFRRSLFDEPQTQNEEQNQQQNKEQNQQTQTAEQPLEKRKLPQIVEDLKKERFHLAEYFLLQVQNYDSALYHYQKFIKTYQDSVLTPKALYSMYYIYSQPSHSDSLKRDSLEQILVGMYPQSSFAREILKRKGFIQEKQEQDSLDVLGHRLFRQAETLYEENELDSALKVYQKLASLDSNLMWSAKAQYARAWIYEHDIGDLSQAVAEYRRLKENYNQPEFASIASKKIAPPPKETGTQTGAAVSDTAAEHVFPGDTTKVTPGAVVDTSMVKPEQKEDSSLPIISNMKKYRQWRQQRQRD